MDWSVKKNLSGELNGSSIRKNSFFFFFSNYRAINFWQKINNRRVKKRRVQWIKYTFNAEPFEFNKSKQRETAVKFIYARCASTCEIAICWLISRTTCRLDCPFHPFISLIDSIQVEQSGILHLLENEIFIDIS